ncbi:GNAT family N-acetyltransferase [uncultured Psychrobacter sp.]|uniref:GNAT family N-acetyltransferase n=1 Tax=uncultured Psychrobacter sp. TaxID=259303 RepID=UPI00345745EB
MRKLKDLARYLPWVANAKDEDFFLIFINKSLHDYADGKSLTCAIIYERQIVGNISFNQIDYKLSKASIGYWLSQAYRGRGIVTKCVAHLIKIGFDELKLNKVEIRVATDNASSRAVPERLGFKLEGIITQAENVNGIIVDHAVYGYPVNLV